MANDENQGCEVPRKYKKPNLAISSFIASILPKMDLKTSFSTRSKEGRKMDQRPNHFNSGKLFQKRPDTVCFRDLAKLNLLMVVQF